VRTEMWVSRDWAHPIAIFVGSFLGQIRDGLGAVQNNEIRSQEPEVQHVCVLD